MPAKHFVPKLVTPGDPIRSSDWNAALTEIARLSRVLEKLERKIGLKPAAAKARPRGEGVRPGAEGVRPGAEGVRR